MPDPVSTVTLPRVRLRSPSGSTLHLAGGILGLAEEGPAVAGQLGREPYDGILLGIPFEDLDKIRGTAGKESTTEFERDDADDVYLKALGRFGAVKVPPSDLYAAYAHAEHGKIPIEAIDLGDEGHAEVWSKHVGMFEVLRNNKLLRGLGAESFLATTAEAFAKEWDGKLFPTKGLRRVQEEREAWMANRVAEFLQTHRRVFALVPVARWEGVRRRLREASWTEMRSEPPGEA